MKQRTFTQEEFRKELLEGAEPFLVDPMELSKESLKLLEEEYSKTGFSFSEIPLEDVYIRKGQLEEHTLTPLGWGHKDYYRISDLARDILKVLPEKTMNRVTDREKLQALLDGKILAYGNSSNLYKALDPEGALKFCTKNKVFEEHASSIIDLKDASLILEWYEEIPEEGVVCFVWNDTLKEKRVETIMSYGAQYEWNFISKTGENIQYATPLTSEQLTLHKQLMDSFSAL